MVDNPEIEKQQDADKKQEFSEIDSKYQYTKLESHTPLKSDHESNLRKIFSLVITAIIIIGVLSFFTVYMFQEPQKKLEPRTLYVGGMEVDRYARIQDAINASNDGDTVYVHIGTYYENLVINRSINLIGEDKNKTVIDGDEIGITAKIMADKVNFSDFTVKNSGIGWSEFDGSSIFDAGIYILSDNNFIYDNIIENNNNDGIALKNSNNNSIFDNSVMNNKYDGIICRDSCNMNRIFDNIISDNGQHGIFLTDNCNNNSIYKNKVNNNNYGGIIIKSYSCYNIIFNNDIRNNAISCSYDWGGINLCFSAHDNNIFKNSIENNKYGFYLGSAPYNNIIISNSIKENLEYGLYFYDSSNNDFLNNSIYHNNFINYNQVHFSIYSEGKCINIWDNGYPAGGNYWSDYTGEDKDDDGIGDEPYILNFVNLDEYPLSRPISYTYYVDDDYDASTSGWGYDHFARMQDGIDVASDGDTVYVNNGIYYENIVIDKSISLTGENKNTTVIDGNQGSEYVVNISSDSLNLSGFTIQNGQTALGGGIFINSNDNSISENIIKNNTDGIRINNYDSYSISSGNEILDNIIINNEQAGISGYLVYNSYITENTISYNGGEGILLYSSYSNIISKNAIKENDANGIYMMRNSNSNVFSENILINNSNGISLQFNCNSNTLSNNKITNNRWGGISLQDSTQNKIFENNISQNNQKGIYLYLHSSSNTISSNNIADNKYGISLDPNQYTCYNQIYHNNFINNTQNINSESNTFIDLPICDNIWYNSEMGNYWSDYSEKYPDATGSNDIWDTPYNISGGNNQDYYPLMNPVDI